MNLRFYSALKLAKNIARYGGIYTILIHPNITRDKLRFEKGFIAAVKDFFHFASLKQFGSFWAARNEVDIDVRDEGAIKRLIVTSPKIIKGLTLQIPSSWVLKEDSNNPIKVAQEKNALIISRFFSGTLEITLQVR